jgi:predicted deacylase
MKQLFHIYHFDSGAPGPHVLITAAVHGDEFEPVLAAESLIQDLSDFLIKGKVSIVPVVNMSAYTKKTRCGEDGLDLARTCPGNQHGTITEQVAFQVSDLIRKADYYIDLHTGGKIFDIFPLAGYMLHDSKKILEAQRKMAETFGLPVIWGTDRYAEGRTLSVARDANVPAIYVEHGGPGPISQDIIDEYKQGCLNVLASLSMVSTQATSKQKPLYMVEDYRVNNGHLQSKTPAPVEGMFIPAVQPGRRVSKGESWGVIQNSITGESTEISTDADGVVLFTRISGFVKKNDSLGGVLPITEPGKIIFDEQ